MSFICVYFTTTNYLYIDEIFIWYFVSTIKNKITRANLTILERYYQELYKTVENDNLNCFLVTTKDKTGRHTEETKRKMSESAKGKKKTAEHIAKLPQNQKGYKGKKRSEETKLKQSLNNGKARKVYQYTKDNEFIKEWRNVTEAEKAYSINNVSGVALGKLKTCGGFKWRYDKL